MHAPHDSDEVRPSPSPGRRPSRAQAREATRQRICDAVAAEPGIRTGTLCHRLGLDYKTVLWHVRQMLASGRLRAVGDGHRRLFVSDPAKGVEASSQAIAAGSPTARLVLQYLQTHRVADFRRMCADLALPASTASGVVTRLARTGLVTKRRSMRCLTLSLADAARTPTPHPGAVRAPVRSPRDTRPSAPGTEAAGPDAADRARHHPRG